MIRFVISLLGLKSSRIGTESWFLLFSWILIPVFLSPIEFVSVSPVFVCQLYCGSFVVDSMFIVTPTVFADFLCLVLVLLCRTSSHF